MQLQRIRAALQRDCGRANSINESSPLLSAVRGVLPLENADRPPMEAVELRRMFEDPPYGWDGNAIKVALALLLRGGSCKFVIDGRPVTDPIDPDAQLVLTREQRFRNLRVWGVSSDVSPAELLAIRGYLETIFTFDKRPQIVTASLNNALGHELERLMSRCNELQQWAATVNFPLPATFTAGKSVVDELLANPTAAVRLRHFAERFSDLQALVEQVDRLQTFQAQSGRTFMQVRDYFNRMVNANLNLPALQTFLADWNTLATERRFDDSRRWNELVQSYQQAETAVQTQIERWVAEAHQRVQSLSDRLDAMVYEAGVPDNEVPRHEARLREKVEQYRAGIPDSPTLADARNLDAQFRLLQLDITGALEKLREEFKPPIDPAGAAVKLRDVVPDREIRSEAELDDVLAEIRQRVLEALNAQGVTV